MKGGRWWIWTVIPGGGAGNLLASLAPGWERYTASRVGQALAKHLNLPIVVIEARTRREAENALDIAPVQGEATFANPTLVHHGMINAASHHLLEDPGGSAVPLPLADLYSFRQKDAERVAQALSSGLRKRVMLLDNSGLPGALHHHPALDVGPLARRQRRLGNPAGLPVRGEVWTTVLGGRFKVLDATPTTVQGRHLDSGNREWIERREFLATYKPPRQRNPRRAHAVTVAQAWLEGGPARRTPNPKGRAVIDSEWKARREARRKWGRGAQVWSGGVVGNKTFVVGVLTHAGSAFQAIGSGDSWEAAFTDAKGKRRPKPNPAIHFDRRSLPDIAQRVVAAAFPSYRGNKFQLAFADSIRVDNLWSGGSKEDTVFVRLDTMQVYRPPDTYQAGAQEAPIPDGVVAVQHVMFTGTDLGIRFVVPSSAARLFPPPEANATQDELIVLDATRSYKSSYGGVPDYRFKEAASYTGISRDRWEAARAALIGKRMLNRAGAITAEGRTAVGDFRLDRMRRPAPNPSRSSAARARRAYRRSYYPSGRQRRVAPRYEQATTRRQQSGALAHLRYLALERDDRIARRTPNPKGRNNPTRDQIFSVSGGSVTLAAAVKEFASSYWTKPRRTRFLTFSPDGMSATFQMVGGAGGIYRASFAPGGIIVERPPFTNPKGCKAPALRTACRELLNYVGGWDVTDPAHPIVKTRRALGLTPNPKGRKAATRKKWSERYEDMVSEAADLWLSKANRLAMAGRGDALYLYFRPSSGTQDGAFYWLTDDETPDPLWQLATPEGVRGAFTTRDQVRARVAALAGRLPIIAPLGNPNPKGRNWITEMAEYHRDMGREAFVDKMLDVMPAAGTLRTDLRIAAGKAWDREHIAEGRKMAAERRAALKLFDAEFGTPNPRRRFAVRRVDDLVHSATGDYTQGVWEVVDSTTGKAVFRSYNQRDARTESAYRNKFGSNPRSPFQVGEGVTVPYTGAASYFGRKVTRTRERATIHGVNDDGTVLVLVKRGQGTEQHIFPAAQVRRLPRRGVKATGARVGRVKARLELKGLRARQRGAGAEVERLTNEAECLEARAKLMDPEAPERRNLTARLSRTLTELDAERMIAGELERADPDYRDAHDLTGEDRAATAAWMGGRTSNPKGRKIGIGPRVPAARADTLKVGDVVMPPNKELQLWMLRDAAEKGISSSDLGIMLTEVYEGAPDKRGRWIIFKGYLRDEWYQGRRQYPFTFKARPETPWPLVASPALGNPRGGEYAGARQIFDDWHSDAAGPRRARESRVRVPAQPRALARLGELVSVTYRSDKFAGTTDNPDGRQQLYEHATKRPRPVLASDSDGHVHIVGGRMRPTADGLIN